MWGVCVCVERVLHAYVCMSRLLDDKVARVHACAPSVAYMCACLCMEACYCIIELAKLSVVCVARVYAHTPPAE